MRRLAFTLALALAAAARLDAQSSVDERFGVALHDPRLWAPVQMHAEAAGTVAAEARTRGARPAKLGSIGLLAAAGSFVGGFIAGATLENELAPCSCDDPGLRGGLLGALILPQIVIPTSVHLANDGGGTFLGTLGGSLIGGAAVAAVAVASGSYEIGLFGPPVGALVGSVVAASH